MSIRRRNLMLGAAGATFAASAYRRVGAQETGPIRIGLAIPLSGPMQLFGKDIRIGAELAAELVNKAGGVMGRSIEPVFGDSKALPNDVVSAAREMISSGIRHLCGGTQTGEALALRPVVEAAGAMLFTTGANGAPVTHENFSKRIFRATNNDVESVTAQARLAVEKGGDIAEWASIQYDSASMIAAYNQFGRRTGEGATKLGRQARFQEPVMVKLGTSDFRNQIARIAASPAEGLFVQIPGQDAITFHQQARAFGLASKLKMVLDRGNEVAFARAMKKGLPNNYWTLTFWQPDLFEDVPFSRDLARAYIARTGDVPTGFLHAGSSGLLAYVAAIKAANGNSDPDVLIKLLEDGLRVPTALGDVTYRREDHQVIAPVVYVKFIPADTEVGFKVADGVRYDGLSLLEPATPGQTYQD